MKQTKKQELKATIECSTMDECIREGVTVKDCMDCLSDHMGDVTLKRP